MDQSLSALTPPLTIEIIGIQNESSHTHALGTTQKANDDSGAPSTHRRRINRIALNEILRVQARRQSEKTGLNGAQIGGRPGATALTRLTLLQREVQIHGAVTNHLGEVSSRWPIDRTKQKRQNQGIQSPPQTVPSANSSRQRKSRGRNHRQSEVYAQG